jgi:tetrahydromethanopterin S-methyltransferase subunit G
MRTVFIIIALALAGCYSPKRLEIAVPPEVSAKSSTTTDYGEIEHMDSGARAASSSDWSKTKIDTAWFYNTGYYDVRTDGPYSPPVSEAEINALIQRLKEIDQKLCDLDQLEANLLKAEADEEAAWQRVDQLNKRVKALLKEAREMKEAQEMSTKVKF